MRWGGWEDAIEVNGSRGREMYVSHEAVKTEESDGPSYELGMADDVDLRRVECCWGREVFT